MPAPNSRIEGGWLSKIVTAVLLAAIAAIALLFGVILLVVLLGAALIFFGFLYLRAWQHRRRLGLKLKPKHRHAQGITIEGEYTVHEHDGSKRDDHG